MKKYEGTRNAKGLEERIQWERATNILEDTLIRDEERNFSWKSCTAGVKTVWISLRKENKWLNHVQWVVTYSDWSDSGQRYSSLIQWRWAISLSTVRQYGSKRQCGPPVLIANVFVIPSRNMYFDPSQHMHHWQDCALVFQGNGLEALIGGKVENKHIPVAKGEWGAPSN